MSYSIVWFDESRLFIITITITITIMIMIVKKIIAMT